MRDLRNDGLIVPVFFRTYDNTFRAIIESALVTWVGILIYEISSLAPTGHITVRTMRLQLRGILIEGAQTDLNVGYVMLQIIPIFFASGFLFGRTLTRILTCRSLRASHRA